MVEVPSNPRYVAVGGSTHPPGGIAGDLSGEVVVEPIEVKLQHPVSNLRHHGGGKGDLVREAAHERHPTLVRCAGYSVTAQQYPATVRCHKMCDRTAGEVTADPMEHNPRQHLRFLFPERDHGI